MWRHRLHEHQPLRGQDRRGLAKPTSSVGRLGGERRVGSHHMGINKASLLGVGVGVEDDTHVGLGEGKNDMRGPLIMESPN
jgi:hypothetical protein